MGRFCENCGTELGQGVKFCPNCGKNTGEGTSSESKKTGSSGRVSIQPKTVKASEIKTPLNGATKQQKSGISILLVAVMVIEFLVAGFKYPGFFVQHKGGYDGGYMAGGYGSSSGANSGSKAKTSSGKSSDSDSFASTDSVHYEEEEEAASFLNVDVGSFNYTAWEDKVLSGENPVATFDNGVSVDFGTFSSFEPTDFSVREADEKGIQTERGDMECKILEFKLGDLGEYAKDQDTELPMFVTVSAPIDPSWDPDMVGVASIDEATGEWMPVGSDIDESTHTVNFYPAHFSCYAIYEIEYNSKFTKEENPYDEPLFSYARGDEDKENSPVYLRETVLARRLKAAADADALLNRYKNAPDKEKISFDEGADIVGTITDLGGGITTFNELMETGVEFGEDFNDGVDFIGNAATVTKILYQWYSTGDLLKVASDNWQDLGKMLLDYSIKKFGAAVAGQVVSVLWLMKVCVEKMGNYSIYLMRIGAGSDEEYAYRRFTRDFVFVNIKTIQVSYQYRQGAVNNATTQITDSINYGDKDKVRLLPPPKSDNERTMQLMSMVRTGDEAEWKTVLEAIAEKNANDPMAAISQIDSMLDTYTRAFWRMKAGTRNTFIEDMEKEHLIDKWEQPDKSQMNKMSAKFKDEIISANYDIIKKLVDKVHRTFRDNTYAQGVNMEKLLNEKMTFTLRDDAVSNFQESEYMGKKIVIRQFAFKNEGAFQFDTREKVPTITCTRYAWMQASRNGVPKFVDIYTDDGVQTFQFKFNDPLTEIVVVGASKPTDDGGFGGLYKIRDGMPTVDNPPNADISLKSNLDIVISVPAFEGTNLIYESDDPENKQYNHISCSGFTIRLPAPYMAADSLKERESIDYEGDLTGQVQYTYSTTSYRGSTKESYHKYTIFIKDVKVRISKIGYYWVNLDFSYDMKGESWEKAVNTGYDEYMGVHNEDETDHFEASDRSTSWNFEKGH